MTDELKPVRCGCGGEAVVWNYNNPEGIAWSVVYCEDCKIQTLKLDTEAEAITAWNRAMRPRLPKEFTCPICHTTYVFLGGE